MRTDVVVVDASLAVKWVLEEDDTEKAEALLEAWASAGVQIIVPSWFACEVANILHQRVMRGEITVQQAVDAVRSVLITVTVAEDDPAIAIGALMLASLFTQKHTYDCQYVALADALDCACWTADERFWRAVGGDVPRLQRLGDYQLSEQEQT